MSEPGGKKHPPASRPAPPPPPSRPYGEVCPICETERRKQRRRKHVRDNPILAAHPDHGSPEFSGGTK